MENSVIQHLSVAAGLGSGGRCPAHDVQPARRVVQRQWGRHPPGYAQVANRLVERQDEPQADKFGRIGEQEQGRRVCVTPCAGPLLEIDVGAHSERPDDCTWKRGGPDAQRRGAVDLPAFTGDRFPRASEHMARNAARPKGGGNGA